jgi:eukaryotic translation initiation factor 2C
MDCLDKFHKNRKTMPTRVIIYRNGCSEGQFKGVIQYEVPLIYAALMKKKCDAKVTVIVANKMHNVRFFNKPIRGDRAPEQNVKPGTVIDTQAVHPKWHEFYLNSHTALQGTTKTPRFTVLVDDNKLSGGEIQTTTYWLSYGHQIVSMPTGLPSPVYIAMQYAKRGRQVYNVFIRESTSSNGNNADLPSNEELTDRFKYMNNRMQNYRTNA